jgi:tetratricopeptide (TPR) repeat protein
VSQLFDSLRRDASSRPRTHAPRTPHPDAVLATLGYTRLKRRPISLSLEWVVLALAILGASWAGWRLYDRSAPARPLARANSTSSDPRNLDALVNLAIAQRTAGQFDLAKETLLKALTIAPRNAAAHYNLGQLYDQTNEPARAVEHYRTFLDTAGAERVSRAAAVRARIAALSRTPE